jgi:hypothetical protein
MIVPRQTSFDGAPSDDEVEVTVLGPGYGECVLVHVGGRWMVIDSYETATGEQHPALKYLEFRLVPLTAVQWLVATHWHDDHVGDFDRLVECLPDRPIVVSAAMDHGELLTGLLRIPSDEHRSNGVAVFQRVSEIADDRDSGLEFGKAGVPLVLRDLPVGISGRLDLLSPSSSTMQHGFEQVSRLLRVVADGHRVRVPRPRRNHLAVAGWFRAQWQPSDEPPGEEVSILLGADLEVTAHPRIRSSRPIPTVRYRHGGEGCPPRIPERLPPTLLARQRRPICHRCYRPLAAGGWTIADGCRRRTTEGHRRDNTRHFSGAGDPGGPQRTCSRG